MRLILLLFVLVYSIVSLRSYMDTAELFAIEPFQESRREETSSTDLSLDQLMDDYSEEKDRCNNRSDAAIMENVVLPTDITHSGRKIPRVIHLTSKTRCMAQLIHDNLSLWKFENHSVYFHDDAAVDKLLSRDWPEFPYLKLVVDSCLVSGAALADLWRYLILWEYGGIYSDIDNAPGQNLLNGTAIGPQDDAYFLQEWGGFLSQYFMAVSPRHPLMFASVTSTLLRLLNVGDVGNQYVPRVTGPGALMQGFHLFTQKFDPQHHKPLAGLYTGLGNRTVTVVGQRTTCNEWVHRSVFGGKAKHMAWDISGMTIYHAQRKKSNESCAEALNALVRTRLKDTLTSQEFSGQNFTFQGAFIIS